ncbi:MAG: HPF/RaiA family ribosome-associated protein [Candidatus Zixiibacteriota bacterium]
MQVQVNTDHNIEVCVAKAAKGSEVIETALARLSDRITRVEVHLSDVNSDKSSENDKRCVIEARLERRRPLAVSHQAATLDQAVDGAVEKLTRLIESTLGRSRDRRIHETDQIPPDAELGDE